MKSECLAAALGWRRVNRKLVNSNGAMNTTDWQTDRCVTLEQKRDAKLRRIPLSYDRRHRRKQSVWIVGVSRLNISRMTGLTITQSMALNRLKDAVTAATAVILWSGDLS